MLVYKGFLVASEKITPIANTIALCKGKTPDIASPYVLPMLSQADILSNNS
jgi:hypothetical protein